MADAKIKEVKIPEKARTVLIVVEADEKGILQKKLVWTAEEIKAAGDMKAETPVAYYGKNKNKCTTLCEYSDGMTIVVPKGHEGVSVVMPNARQIKVDDIFPLYKDNQLTVRSDAKGPVTVYNVGQATRNIGTAAKPQMTETKNLLHVENGKVTAITYNVERPMVKETRVVAGLLPENMVANRDVAKTMTVHANTRVEHYKSPVTKKVDAVGIFKLTITNGVAKADLKPFVSAGAEAEVEIKGSKDIIPAFTLSGKKDVAVVVSDLDAYRNKLAENTLYLNGMLETVNGGEEDINKKKFTRLDVKTYDLEFDKDGKTKATKPKTKTILDLKKEKVGFAPELMHRLKDAVTFIPVNTDSDFTPMAVQPKDKVQALG